MKHIISLGAGVQSSTMALMAAHGEIKPMPDLAIFADTAEPQSVYSWLDWLELQLPYEVRRVSRPKIVENALKVKTSSKTGSDYLQARIPAFTLNAKGEKGTLWRQCTSFWKVEPIQKEMAQYKDEGVILWFGISKDEAHRQKDSRKKWIQHYYPLIELGMTRQDCLEWMEHKHYPTPPRSSCVFCPYHSDAEWIRLKTEEPKEFQRAVDFEKQLQTQMGKVDRMNSTVYLHSSLKPLETIQFRHENQPNMFGNECEGMCGV